MSHDDTPDRDETPGRGGRAPRGRLVVTGAGALVVCAAVVAAAVWLLVTPQPVTSPPGPVDDPSATVTAGAPAPATTEPEEPAVSSALEAGDGSDLAVATAWAQVMFGWTAQERDASAARERAAQLAPGAQVEVLAGAVLDHAAALAAGAPQASTVEVVDVSDPSVWPAGWVVLDVTVTTVAAPQAGVPGLVLHALCEVEVSGAQVVTVLIGDGAAWIEYPA